MKCIEGKINKGMGIENEGDEQDEGWKYKQIGENILFMIM